MSSALNRFLDRKVSSLVRSPERAARVGRMVARQHSGVSLETLRHEALVEVRDGFRKSGRTADVEQVAYEAHLVLTAASLRKPWVSVELPRGADKTTHAFMSATLAAWLAEGLSRVPGLPSALARDAGRGMARAAGFFKELADLGGSGFSLEDLRANDVGLKGVFSSVED
ncbi:MAG: hypothetical protein VKO21_05980 [Candidatus Sericytochromatia bacterium]|nr:hypothetical protein [Candidatus Sericytochromatia bacterium]